MKIQASNAHLARGKVIGKFLSEIQVQSFSKEALTTEDREQLLQNILL